MYQHNPNSAESILNKKLENASFAWVENQRDLVIEAMQEYADKDAELLKECFDVSERAKQLLREKGYGWTGLDIFETCKLVPQNETTNL